MTRSILCLAALFAVMHAGAMAQNSAQLTPDGYCDSCQQAPVFPKLRAMLAAHRTQAGYASYGGSCQKGCCQKGCVQKGCVQKGCVQKGCVQKGCVQKGCVQKGCVQKGCVQKPCAPKCCAPKCVQKSCVQKPCAPKCCAPKCVQKSCAPKGCCQKSSLKGCSGRPRGLLLSLGLFNRGGKCGKGCCGTSCGPTGTGGTVFDELPTPVVNDGGSPFQDDPNPLHAAGYNRG